MCTSIPFPTPRITGENSQILRVSIPLLSACYDVWGGTHTTIPLKTKQNQHDIQLLPHRDEWHKGVCSAGKETFFYTDSSRHVVQECSLQFQVMPLVILPSIWIKKLRIPLFHSQHHGLQVKFHRYCEFRTLFYPAVMMFEEVHIPLSLWRQNWINITFNCYLTETHETREFTPQVTRISSLPTVPKFYLHKHYNFHFKSR